MTKRFSGTIILGREDMDRIAAEVRSENEGIGNVKATGEVLSALTLAMYTCGARHATYRIFEGSRAITISHMTGDGKSALKEYLAELAEHIKVKWDIHKGKLKKKVKEDLNRHAIEIAKVDPLKCSLIAVSVFEKHFRLEPEDAVVEEKKPA